MDTDTEHGGVSGDWRERYVKDAGRMVVSTMYLRRSDQRGQVKVKEEVIQGIALAVSESSISLTFLGERRE